MIAFLMRRHNITSQVGWLIVLLVLAIAGCRPGSRPTGSEVAQGARGGVLSVRLTVLPKTFNPLLAADEPALLLGLYLTSSRLVDFDHPTQNYVPALAESWQVVPGGREVEVKLRDGLKFSDGHTLTAEDVAFALRAVYDERTGAPLLRDAMLVDGQPIEARVIDSQHLRFTFPAVVAALESYLSNLPILPRHLLEEELKQGRLNAAWGVATDPQHIVTSGPFVIEAFQPGERLRLKRNPHYWKKDGAGIQLPYLDGLTLEAVSDPSSTLLRLTQGALDLADRIRPADFAALQPAAQVKAYDAGPGLSTDHLWFNLNPGGDSAKKGWFNEARFRRAVAHAIDRDTIAQKMLRGLATPLYGFVSPGNRVWVAADLPRTPYDLGKALALLHEAGFTGGDGGADLRDKVGRPVAFTLLVQAENESRKQMAVVIQQDLARLGVRVDIATLDTPAVNERWSKTFDYDAVLLGLNVTDPDPSSYANFLRSDSATHQWHPRQTSPQTKWETRIDQLVLEQARTMDRKQRAALFAEIQRLMADHLPVIPVVARHSLTAAQNRLGNLRPSAIFPYSLWNIDVLFLRPQ